MTVAAELRRHHRRRSSPTEEGLHLLNVGWKRKATSSFALCAWWLHHRLGLLDRCHVPSLLGCRRCEEGGRHRGVVVGLRWVVVGGCRGIAGLRRLELVCHWPPLID
ncbi:hypothetical protein OsJ_27248 [Oryza sativa Japonica Group]|uniref:Uncharacterized protein n=1 Tax=Oryza sativa subsp. japonica TaxID=39947 RepID=A3BSZ2_ORYSJ|nr:hypothetical protein OsJ_27248 [Oryza sativa Japonica Group]